MLDEKNKRIFASRYRLHLPSEAELRTELRREVRELGGPRKEGSWLRQTTLRKTRCFSVVDIIAGLTDSKNPRDYWYRMKKRQMGARADFSCRQFVDNCV